jgi:5-methylcytosine-specific restriction protein B
MSIPSNITREHLLLAIEKIDKERVPSDAASRYYDVFFNNKKYPPKLVVSYANIFANGSKLDHNTFEGGLNKPCFKLLQSSGFEIIQKTNEVIMEERVLIYEIKSGSDSQNNALTLKSDNNFYWNDKTFQNEKVGVHVFVVNPTGKWGYYSKISEKDIIATFDTIQKKSTFTHLGNTFNVDDPDGRYTTFVRFEIIQTVKIPENWRWERPLGSSEKMYLFKDEELDVEKITPRLNDLKKIFIEGEANELLLKVESLLILNNKVSPIPKIWFVTQGATFNSNQGMKFLWAPKIGQDGRNRFYWDNVLNVKKGDIIFNYSDGLQAVSVATNDGYDAPNPNPGQGWNNDGNRVDIELVSLTPIITGNTLASNNKNIIQHLSTLNNKPFNINGGVNQGYLYEFTLEAGRYIRDLYGKKFGNEYIDAVFDKINIKQQSMGLDFNHKYRKEIAAIKTKPFLLMAGISGTGKSRMVRTLAYKTCPDHLRQGDYPGNFINISVKPNWHDSIELLGYVSRIGRVKYVVTDFIKFLIKAWSNHTIPFFVCLDEMNLAPVEQYFAEYLSKIESRKKNDDGTITTDSFISAEIYNNYKANFEEVASISPELDLKFKITGVGLPSNLIIIGTVNMDETTHSFSRKVLDRAMTFEKNLDNEDGHLTILSENTDWSYSDSIDPSLFLPDDIKPTKDLLTNFSEHNTILERLNEINNKLNYTAFMIAYRTLDEAIMYAYNSSNFSNKPTDWLNQVLDDIILMKILPRIEGDERKTQDVLNNLEILLQKAPRSLKKCRNMIKKLTDSGYTSYWN